MRHIAYMTPATYGNIADTSNLSYKYHQNGNDFNQIEMKEIWA